MDQYRNFIALSRYARWIPEKNRRETWEETVDRYISFWTNKGLLSDPKDIDDLSRGIKEHHVMPSMRALMSAGKALDKDNMAGFNCSYSVLDGGAEKLTLTHEKLDDPVVVSISDPVCFDEIMYILMVGTGVGFSAERQYVTNLPKVGNPINKRRYLISNKNYPNVDKEELSTFNKKTNTIVVEDSKYGWASALRVLLFELWSGNFSIQWDVSKLRPAGAKLNTFGGRASGPQPLVDLFSFAVDLFKKANGRKLSSIECHDLVCKIADVVVVGGVEA